MLIDSHTHLLDEKYTQPDKGPSTPEELIAAARANHVRQMITIATKPQQWSATIATAERHSGIVGAAVGLHPGHADEEPLTLPQLLQATENKSVVALGETGLDYYYHKEDEHIEKQKEIFRLHLEACRHTGLPAIIHTRDADVDTLMILNEFPDVPFVLHCFTGSRELALEAVKRGGYISFSGILTFKKSTELRDIAAILPADRILIETDAPYLAPEPHRGHRNHPALVVHVAEMLAKIRAQPLSEIATQTVKNTHTLFPRLAALA